MYTPLNKSQCGVTQAQKFKDEFKFKVLFSW